MPACQPGRHPSCWLCLMSRWLLYSVMIPDPTWTLQTNLHWPRSAAGATCVTRALVRVSPCLLCGAIQSDHRGTLNIFTRTGLFVTRFMWSLPGSQTPRAGNEKRALLGAKYLKDKSLQWIFSAKYLSISDKNKFLFTEPFAWQSSPSLYQTTSPLLVSDAGILGFPAQWKLFDTNFQWSE